MLDPVERQVARLEISRRLRGEKGRNDLSSMIVMAVGEELRKMKDKETVPCGLCGRPTPMTGTRRCDPCWELEWRVRDAPDVARKVLAAMPGKADDLSLALPKPISEGPDW